MLVFRHTRKAGVRQLDDPVAAGAADRDGQSAPFASGGKLELHSGQRKVPVAFASVLFGRLKGCVGGFRQRIVGHDSALLVVDDQRRNPRPIGLVPAGMASEEDLYARPHPLGAQLQESGAIAVVEAPVARLR
jgi:hypothetical protein